MPKLSISNSELLKQFPGQVAWKDLNSVYLGGNKNVAELVGFKHPEDIVGTTDFDLPCAAAEHAAEFIAKDQTAIQEERPVRELCIDHYANNELNILLTNKSPFYDNDNQVAGVVCVAQTLNPNPLIKKLLTVHESNAGSMPLPGSYDIVDNIPKFNLTKKETLVFYHFLRGRTAKETARMLGISHRTVEQHLGRVKSKMQCLNKSQLFEKAMEHGLINIIPLDTMLTFLMP